jgi:sarcosine oxidase gamma subunit
MAEAVVTVAVQGEAAATEVAPDQAVVTAAADTAAPQEVVAEPQEAAAAEGDVTGRTILLLIY